MAMSTWKKLWYWNFNQACCWVTKYCTKYSRFHTMLISNGKLHFKTGYNLSTTCTRPATLINIALSAVMLLIGSLIVTYVRFDRDHTTLRFSEPKDHEAERAKFGGKLFEITRKGMKKVLFWMCLRIIRLTTSTTRFLKRCRTTRPSILRKQNGF